jgi:hypothetical protein
MTDAEVVLATTPGKLWVGGRWNAPPLQFFPTGTVGSPVATTVLADAGAVVSLATGAMVWFQSQTATANIHDVRYLSPSGGVPTTLAGGQSNVVGLSADDGGVCWSANGDVRCSEVNSGPAVAVARGLPVVTAVARGGGWVYWAESPGPPSNRVVGCPIGDGCDAGHREWPLADGGARSLAVVGGSLWWCETARTDSACESFARVALPDGGVVTTTPPGTPASHRFAVDGESVCLALHSDAGIQMARLPLDGGRVQVLATLGELDPARCDIHVSGQDVYWSTNRGIYRMCPP